MATEKTTKKREKPQATGSVEKPEVKPKPAKASGFWKNLKDYLAPIVGVFFLGFYVIFLLSLRGSINAEETQWMRWIYLLSGVEAIAFAAAGYFFGSEVNRKAAEYAQEEADSAKSDAAEAGQQAMDAEKISAETVAKGRALSAAIDAKTKASRTRSASYGSLGGTQVAGISKSDLEELADLANQLFP
jgi:hypothetical protein